MHPFIRVSVSRSSAFPRDTPDVRCAVGSDPGRGHGAPPPRGGHGGADVLGQARFPPYPGLPLLSQCAGCPRGVTANARNLRRSLSVLVTVWVPVVRSAGRTEAPRLRLVIVEINQVGEELPCRVMVPWVRAGLPAWDGC